MGIKGFRAWFESQFPDAMLDIPKVGGQTGKGGNVKDSGASGIQGANTKKGKKGGADKTVTTEEFDHVLVDMNQLLHIVVRKSRSDGHGLILLMKELDDVLATAVPKQSLVLAMDGPPSAAKVATQRKRRLAVITKSDWKLKHMSKFRRMSAKQLALKKRRAASELRTLCLTPGTDFMKLAEQAVLYWAWQRLSSQNNVLSQNNVKLFVSPSTVAGEGEVKLLEWIYSKQRRGESIAILGGDSDLVLEGLVIPPALTHNVFVLLPDGNRRYLCVSLWETTRTLDKFFGQEHNLLGDQPENLMRVRTDLVVLLILNGNDYLPKLRGSSGFNKLFHSFLRVHREWNDAGKGDQAYLVDPDTLEFNIPFCLAYFRHLAALAPANIWAKNKVGTVQETDRTSALQQLRTMVDSGFVPKPLDFTVVRDDGEEDDGSVDNDDDDEEDEEALVDGVNDEADTALDDDEDDDTDAEDEEGMLVRLSLGEPGSEDFFTYEIWQPEGASLKKSRQKLSAMALEDLMGLDADDIDDDDEDLIPGLTNTGYDWEIHHSVPGKTDAYLYGLLWNLQTYQDGVCADYAYNYGKRLSPTAGQIVEFLEAAQKENRIVGVRELAERPFSPPINAGLSCLAALPSKVKELVPEPYCWLSNDTVEGIYGSCMDPDDNVFDMKKFERLCEEQVEELRKLQDVNGDGPNKIGTHDERRIVMGDHYWTVISKVKAPLTHPFDPPAPFTERLSKLRPNNRIRISRCMATKEPLPRTVWTDEKSATNKSSETKKKKGFVSKETRDLSRHSDPGPFIASHDSIDQVPYKTAYSKPQGREGSKKGKLKITVKLSEISIVSPDKEPKKNGKEEQKKKKTPTKVSVAARMKEFNVQRPPKEPVRTLDGVSPMACLKQLEDIGVVGALSWEDTKPSTSAYAEFDPKGHESVRLFVGKGTDLENAALFEDLVYEQDRDINLVPRQAIKHHLASLALRDIAGPKIKWSELVFKDLREHLSQKSRTTTVLLGLDKRIDSSSGLWSPPPRNLSD
jgi:hypothetical protein